MNSDIQGMIERGKILKQEKNGYTVTSLDRNGIITGPLKAMNSEKYTTGEMVYFFSFRDGTGGILGTVS